jgi:Gas vesicle synthesis protein GvpL/GvpF
MPALLYCVAKQAVINEMELTGVAGTPVRRREWAGLAAFFSPSEDSAVWLRAPLRTSALEFHRVCMAAFESDAIIRYRFPTVFQTEQELAGYLEQHAAEYNQVLRRIAGMCQMEVRVAWSVETGPAPSGTQYLQERQSRLRAVEAFGHELGKSVQSIGGEWRQRISRDNLHGFGLVRRAQVEDFRHLMSNVRVPEKFSMRKSGPWPVTEFLDLQS